MDKETFMLEMAEILDVTREELNEQTILNESNWDSLAHLAAISFFDEQFGVTISAKELMAVQAIGELMDLVERKIQLESTES